MTSTQLWQATLGELEILLSKPHFSTWFKETFIISFEHEKVVVGVPNSFTKTWLEKKYHPLVIKALRNVSQASVKDVIYKVEAPDMVKQVTPLFQKEAFLPVELDEQIIAREEQSTPTSPSGLNNKYTFENFIVGKYCELACAACHAVASQPGEVYNPLFIYGGVGLGKTHLLQALGNELVSRFPSKRVLFVTCEKFTNDFIQAVRSGRGKELKETYRTVDVLLIDDIQFLSSKEGTQEEFFHTFNTLHHTNKQLIIASDRPPKAIPAIENRLQSRLEWGMIADISSPDLETRIAILEVKCKEKQFSLSPDAINYIATIVHSNIRELEGALNRIIAFTQLNKAELGFEKIKSILSSITANYAKKSLSPKQLMQIVADFYNITIEALMSESRKRELATPRQITMYLMREETKYSFPMIGQVLGGRDHTTAIHAYNKIQRSCDENIKIKQDIDLLRQRIYNI